MEDWLQSQKSSLVKYCQTKHRISEFTNWDDKTSVILVHINTSDWLFSLLHHICLIG